MDKDEQNDQDEQQETPADRGIPSVASQPKGRLVLMAGFLGLALLAMGFVIMDGVHKNAPVSLTMPDEVSFRTQGNTALPYIEPESGSNRLSLDLPVPPEQKYDLATMQREQALQEEALRIARQQQQKIEQRLHSPQLVFDQAGNQVASTSSYGDTGNDAGQNVQTVKARQLKNLHALIPQGTIIAGILETAIQTDLPGMIRAIVSENVYSFDGSRLLIPKGSKLIGNYRSGIVRGQSRVFVIWERLIRNDGVSINIDSFGTDSLGRAGLSGDVNTHFLERFGSSVLLSLIDTGLKIGAQSLDNDNTATVALETGSDFSRSAEIALENSIAIAPTINVNQGTLIKVFVGKDLDFSQVTEK